MTQPLTNSRLRAIAAWVVDTCYLYDVPPATAHLVSAAFVDGLQRERKEKGDGALAGSGDASANAGAWPQTVTESF